MNALMTKVVDVAHIFGVQKEQYQEILPVYNAVIPRKNQITIQALVSGMGDFVLDRIQGTFSTLSDSDNEGSYVDDGVSGLAGQLRDGYQKLPLWGDFVPLEMVLTPGRVRNAAALNNTAAHGSYAIAPASNNLFYPLKFEYTFLMNSYIEMDVRNSKNADQYLSLAFIGHRLRQRSRTGQHMERR